MLLKILRITRNSQQNMKLMNTKLWKTFAYQLVMKESKRYRSIRGKGAFRRFKNKIVELNIEDQWYSYRNEMFKQIAIRWCKDNNINLVE
nr:UPF0158 family protein [Alkalihalobacillus sp. TS-13]